VISDVTFKNNAAENGGGLYLENTQSTLRRVSFTSNRAEKEGAGLYQTDGALTVTDSSFVGNDIISFATVMQGAGAAIHGGTATFGATHFEGNVVAFPSGGTAAPERGAALYVDGGTVLLDSDVFFQNGVVGWVSSAGAGLFASSAVITARHSIFDDNHILGGDLFGGGISLVESTFFFASGEVTRNRAGNAPSKSGFGAIYAESSSVTLVNSHVFGNSASKDTPPDNVAASIYVIGQNSQPSALHIVNSDLEDSLVHADASTTGSITNCTFTKSSFTMSGLPHVTGNLLVSYSCLPGASFDETTPGETNRDDCFDSPTPLLENLGSNAALPIDVADLDGDGDIAEQTPVDYDGNPRIVRDKVDMGRLEAQ
jgi:hypothetical protein